jgi:hypothetical protein
MSAGKRTERRNISCPAVYDLDLQTLIWTRGERFPRDQLESRLRWPKCGQMNVHVMWRCPISRSGMRRPEARKKPLIVKRQSQLDQSSRTMRCEHSN